MENIYAVLLLHKLAKEVNEGNIKKVIESAGGVADDSQIKSLLASLNGVDIAQELENASLAVAAPVSAPTEKKAEAPKEEKHEAAAEGLSALFG